MSLLGSFGVAAMFPLLCAGCREGLPRRVADSLQDAERSHGHLGPYVLIGQRMGEHALRALGAERHFGVEVTVACSGRPPQSCLVDGLQLSTGATYGKRNVTFVEASEIQVTVADRKNGRRLSLTLTGKAKAAIAAMGKDHEAVERTARAMAGWPDEDLFAITPEPRHE